MDVVDGHTDRLIPVTQIDLHDIDWSLGEMTRMREAGSRAFVIPEAPVRGRGSAADGSRAVGRSITPSRLRSDLGRPPRTWAWRPSRTSASAGNGSTPGGPTTAPTTCSRSTLLNMLVGSQIGAAAPRRIVRLRRSARAAPPSRGRRRGGRHRLAAAPGHRPGADGRPDAGGPPRRRVPAGQPRARRGTGCRSRRPSTSNARCVSHRSRHRNRSPEFSNRCRTCSRSAATIRTWRARPTRWRSANASSATSMLVCATRSSRAPATSSASSPSTYSNTVWLCSDASRYSRSSDTAMSVSETQGWRSTHHTSTPGRTADLSSSVPAFTATTPAVFASSDTIGEPHDGQNRRRT